MAIEVTPQAISSGYNISKINNNFDEVSQALQDGLSRSGTTPNSMEADFDLDGNDVLNGGVGNFDTIVLDGVPITAEVGSGITSVVAGSAISIDNSDPASPVISATTPLTSWAAITRASGFDTFVATPSSSNLAALVSDEVGDGKLLFAPASTTDNTVARFDSTAGKLQGSVVTISDTGDIATTGAIASVSPFGVTASGGNVVSSLQRTDAHGSSAYLALQPVYGKDSAGNVTSFVRLDFYADDATDGSEDGSYRVTTVVAGTLAERLKVAAGLSMTGATGGDKGAGTINATAVYDDNTLLSCYVFDAAIDGKIDLAKWDGKVPGDRQHEDARRFSTRLDTDTNPLNLDSYIAHWREKRHLTSLPNEEKFDPVQGLPSGAWIQRLVETVEIQAVHISQLHERLKKLETNKL